MESMLGVLRMVFPWRERSPYPWSSVRIRTIFGRRADVWAARGVASRVAIHSRRVNVFKGELFILNICESHNAKACGISESGSRGSAPQLFVIPIDQLHLDAGPGQRGLEGLHVRVPIMIRIDHLR